jgi:hypothetical protein
MKFHSAEDRWWAVTRERLLAIYRLAWTCARGNLPSPLFMVDGRTVGDIRFYGSDDVLEKLAAVLKPGTEGLFHVDYLKTPPGEWKCDL